MARTIIEIPDALLRELDSVCRLLSLSRAEAVRRAVNDWVQQGESIKADGFGLWSVGSRRSSTGPGRKQG